MVFLGGWCWKGDVSPVPPSSLAKGWEVGGLAGFFTPLLSSKQIEKDLIDVCMALESYALSFAHG